MANYFTTNLSAPSQPETVKPDNGNTGATTNTNTFTDALGDTWYKETGTFKITEPVGIRLHWLPRVSSATIAILPAGSTVKYDAFCHADGKVWIRQPRGNSQYGCLPTGDSVNGRRTSYWGTFSE